MKKAQDGADVIPLQKRVGCRECDAGELCLPSGLPDDDLLALEHIVRRRRTLEKGQTLYRMGDPLLALYAVRRGSVKTNLLTQDGRVQVTGFYLPGELIGVDAIDEGRYPCDAIALEVTELCEIPWTELNHLAARIPALNQQLVRLMSREIVRDEELLMMLGHLGAEARLAACLLNFDARYKRLGSTDDRFTLSMSRQDLGDYLGLALETVSRFFTRLHEDGLLDVQGRDVRVLDAERLRAMVSQPNGRRGLRA